MNATMTRTYPTGFKAMFNTAAILGLGVAAGMTFPLWAPAAVAMVSPSIVAIATTLALAVGSHMYIEHKNKRRLNR